MNYKWDLASGKIVNNNQLVLSLFPGIGLLDMAFEEFGFCVVRGPDVLWGGDIKRFHPPADKFNGVIGGPPCQRYSKLRHIVIAKYGESALAEDLIPEFERIVKEAQPNWFEMENVPEAPTPVVPGYCTHSFKLNNRWLGEEQERKRVWTFGMRGDRSIDLRNYIQPAALESIDWCTAVCASGMDADARLKMNGSAPKKRKGAMSNKGHISNATVRISCARQGLPEDFLDKAPFTVEGKQKVIGNGVPLAMGRAIAGAIVQALSR